MAHSESGKLFYGGGDVVFGLVFFANQGVIGGPSGIIGIFLLARGAMTLLGISL